MSSRLFQISSTLSRFVCHHFDQREESNNRNRNSNAQQVSFNYRLSNKSFQNSKQGPLAKWQTEIKRFNSIPKNKLMQSPLVCSHQMSNLLHHELNPNSIIQTNCLPFNFHTIDMRSDESG